MTARLRLAAILAVLVGCDRSPSLPPTLTSESVIRDLATTLDPGTVVAEPAPDAVRLGSIEPGHRLATGGGGRPGVIAPPGSRLRYRLELPPHATLRVEAGVERADSEDRDLRGLAFAIHVDGTTRWSRTVNPAAHRRDRRWFDVEVPLTAERGETVVLVLETSAEAGDGAVAGTPGWGHPRVVQATQHARRPASPATPNLLVVLVDTLRADRVGAYGRDPSPTPALDALAARGLGFTDAVSQSSWTLPSVSTLFTGLHPRSHGAIADGRAGEAGGSWGFLPDGVTTWAELATQAGITSVGVSTNPLVSRGTNLAQGFETFIELPWNAEARQWADAPAVNRAFVEWLRPNRGHRFVAYLHYMEPHDPYTPPAALRPPTPPGMRADLARGWVLRAAHAINRGGPLLTDAELAWLGALYTAEVRAWDDAFGALLASLADLGVLDSTVVVVTADHGEEFQEHGRLLHRTHLYDESVRVPLVIAGPGIAPARRTEPVQGIDLLPTIVALLGLSPPTALPGRPLLAPLAARPALLETHSGIAEDQRHLDLLAWRSDGWKLIQAPALRRTELYDLRRDPGEHDDRSARDPAEATRLERELAANGATLPAPPATGGSDPALHDKLRALGYLD